MRVKTLLAAFLVLAFSIVSTTFTFLALTNKSWSTQTYYFDQNGTELGLTEIQPLCVLERSPFYRCGLPHVYENGTCHISDCAFYKPYGKNQTSCRSSAEYGRVWAENVLAQGLLGMSLECQEVHYAGNLQIAAAFFLTLGLCMTLTLSLITIGLAMGTTKRGSSPAIHHGDSRSKTAEVSATTIEGQAEHHSHHKDSSSSRSPFTPYVVAVLLACLYIGALAQILAQYFGVLGLTVNATPNADTAVGVVHDSDFNHFVADSWAIGRGLSTYATIAWASALVCAALATTVFRTPRFAKLL